MRLRFTPHALLRMRERGVTRRDVRGAIDRPDRATRSSRREDRFLVVRTYQHRRLRRIHALLVVYEYQGGTVLVVTVVDTSKIAKYL